MKFILCFSPIVDLVNTLLEETEINIFTQDLVCEYIALFMHIHRQYSLCIYLYLKMSLSCFKHFFYAGVTWFSIPK